MSGVALIDKSDLCFWTVVKRSYRRVDTDTDGCLAYYLG